MESISTINELWNKNNLVPPPIATYRTEIDYKDIRNLRNIFFEAIKVFQHQGDFEKEAAFLSRYVHCLKTKLRQVKVLKVIGKINQALLRYLRMNFVHSLETFYMLIPKQDDDTYLPTCNMLQYILVRFQGISKLLARVMETSKIAAVQIEQLLSIGHLWKDYLIGFSIVSRVFVLTKRIANFCCTFYAKLFPYIKKLVIPDVQWLPFNYTLPTDLKQWLGVNCFDEKVLGKDLPQNLPNYLFISHLEDFLGMDKESINKAPTEDLTDNTTRLIPQLQLPEDIGVAVPEHNSLISIEKKKSKLLEDVGNDEESINKARIKDLSDNTTRLIPKLKLAEDIGVPVPEHNSLISIEKKKSKLIKKSTGKTHLADCTQTLLHTSNLQEDIGAPVPEHNSLISIKKKKSKLIEKSTTKIHLADCIETINDLKTFQRDLKKNPNKYSKAFKLDKMQCHMLHRTILKYIKKSDKYFNDVSKVDAYLCKAKSVLRCL